MRPVLPDSGWHYPELPTGWGWLKDVGVCSVVGTIELIRSPIFITFLVGFCFASSACVLVNIPYCTIT